MTKYPRAEDAEKVGSYPSSVKAGGGYVWDAVLEYRVWCSPRLGAEDLEDGSDYYYAFADYEAAASFFEGVKGAAPPIALIRQDEYIDEPNPGEFVHIREVRIAEWSVEFLTRPRRTERTIPDFLSPDAPPNRMDILRGTA